MTIQIGFMQGRLSEIENGKIQCFPKKNWEEEFKLANSIDIKLMEWTIDYEPKFRNPILTEDGQKIIKALSKKYSLNIDSLTGDCFMHRPFWKEKSNLERNNLIIYMKNLFNCCYKIGISKIVIPLVDNGRIENKSQENLFIDTLLSNLNLIKKLKLKVIFESDFSPKSYLNFIKKFPSEYFGINYDTGNSASLGFNPTEEFGEYGHRIINVHIKDREHNGSTVPLFKGDTEFDEIFKQLSRFKYDGNLILQTARATDNKHVELIKSYKKVLEKYISEYF